MERHLRHTHPTPHEKVWIFLFLWSTFLPPSLDLNVLCLCLSVPRSAAVAWFGLIWEEEDEESRAARTQKEASSLNESKSTGPKPKYFFLGYVVKSMNSSPLFARYYLGLGRVARCDYFIVCVGSFGLVCLKYCVLLKAYITHFFKKKKGFLYSL